MCSYFPYQNNTTIQLLGIPPKPWKTPEKITSLWTIPILIGKSISTIIPTCVSQWSKKSKTITISIPNNHHFIHTDSPISTKLSGSHLAGHRHSWSRRVARPRASPDTDLAVVRKQWRPMECAQLSPENHRNVHGIISISNNNNNNNNNIQ